LYQTIAEDRLFLSLRSVIIAMHSETLAFEMPPMMRLIKKITNTLEIDQAKYETNVPNLINNNFSKKLLQESLQKQTKKQQKKASALLTKTNNNTGFRP